MSLRGRVGAAWGSVGSDRPWEASIWTSLSILFLFFSILNKVKEGLYEEYIIEFLGFC